MSPARGRPVLTVLRGGRAAHPDTLATPAQTDGHSQPFEVEQDGVFFRREQDQNLAQRRRQADALLAKIRTRAGTHVLKLTNTLVDLAWSEAIDEQMTLLRAIGWMLVSNGRQDLWQLAYLEFCRGNVYVVGDEARFLLDRSPATPTPLHEDDGDVA